MCGLLGKLWWLILGILIGWVLRWLLEIFYWGDKRHAQLTQLEHDLQLCRDEAAGLRKDLASVHKGPAAPAPETEAAAEPAPAPAGAAPSVSIAAQDLTAIQGISPEYARLLQEAGIGTYAQLAGLSNAQLRAIVKPEKGRKTGLAAWTKQARKLAKETGTVNAVWNHSHPDDLKVIVGIGKVFERKLNEAGVSTFQKLGELTAQQVEAMIKPKSWQKYDFASWIAQARERVGKPEAT